MKFTGTLNGIVMAAYNLKDFQVSGGPDWTARAGRNAIYDIVAKTEGDTPPSIDQLRLAMQALLAESAGGVPPYAADLRARRTASQYYVL